MGYGNLIYGHLYVTALSGSKVATGSDTVKAVFSLQNIGPSGSVIIGVSPHRIGSSGFHSK
ncbi:unnamed protein product, partial [marine sediment metagenome]